MPTKCEDEINILRKELPKVNINHVIFGTSELTSRAAGSGTV